MAVASKRRTAKGRLECRWVKLARERHERDLKDGHKRGLWFDEEQAEYVRAFFPRFLRHSKGKFKGKPFELEDWQYHDSVKPMFGWMRLPGKMTAQDAQRIPRKDRRAAGILRRFNTAYEEIARKNGKSTKMAGLGLYMLVADGEGGPDVYTAATTEHQARMVFDEAQKMVRQSPDLRRVLTVQTEAISMLSNFGKMTPLTGDPAVLDGLNIHMSVVDELHAHAKADMYDVLRTAQGARDQPICWAITTAGKRRMGVCWREREYVTRILSGRHHDDSYFGLVYTIDDDDDWRDEACWVKANPGLGTIRRYEDLRDLCTKAEGSPASQNAFRRLYLNQWLESDERALDPGRWRASAGPLTWQELAEAMVGKPCVAGLDMASRFDLAAFVPVFRPREDGAPVVVVPHLWIPEETARERSQTEGVPFDQWIDEGALHAVPGPVIDQEVMLGDIVNHVRPFYEIEGVTYDPWNAAWMVQELQRYRFNCIACKPCFTNLSEATKQLLALVRTGALQHGGHPVLEWMAENLVLYQDRHGNMMPDRQRSKENIDGMVGAVMGIRGLVMSEPPKPSVYARRGALWVGK